MLTSEFAGTPDSGPPTLNAAKVPIYVPTTPGTTVNRDNFASVVACLPTQTKIEWLSPIQTLFTVIRVSADSNVIMPVKPTLVLTQNLKLPSKKVVKLTC